MLAIVAIDTVLRKEIREEITEGFAWWGLAVVIGCAERT
jgi:hypothetical protein